MLTLWERKRNLWLDCLDCKYTRARTAVGLRSARFPPLESWPSCSPKLREAGGDTGPGASGKVPWLLVPSPFLPPRGPWCAWGVTEAGGRRRRGRRRARRREEAARAGALGAYPRTAPLGMDRSFTRDWRLPCEPRTLFVERARARAPRPSPACRRGRTPAGRRRRRRRGRRRGGERAPGAPATPWGPHRMGPAARAPVGPAWRQLAEGLAQGASGQCKGGQARGGRSSHGPCR